MFIDPSLPINRNYAAQYCREHGALSYNEYASNQSDERLKELMPQAMGTYLKKILSGKRSKGTRPWEIVNATSALDPSQAWVGVEWETGFCSNAHYKAAIQWLWENHHNWAVDNEGIGPWLGEFTFPPIEFERFAAGDSMMDAMRSFMASKGMTTPTSWDHIDFKGSEYSKQQYASGRRLDDPRSGWGCHVNISIPETRNTLDLTQSMHELVRVIFTDVLMNSSANCVKLFNRQPYGWGTTRSGTDGTSWIEWKLFKTLATDVEMETMRMVTLKLAVLMRDVATNATKYFPKPAKSNSRDAYVNAVLLPTADDLTAWLLGDADELKLTARNLTCYEDLNGRAQRLVKAVAAQ